ncbi:MAG: hypothetical protein CVU41_09320 [Chloroflexi bacterium HGW-Chloroflexi-3]|nr:MAG: hypothetical protein CVU41_09320 [Chloroflexi bacterium HGW-Chloroflexi-3]
MKNSKFKLFFFIIVLTTIISLPRFAHFTPDSEYYIDLVNFFKGTLNNIELKTPFAYRFLAPLITSSIPIENTTTSFALINLFFTYGAYVTFYFYLRELFTDNKEIMFGILLLIISFPTFNYSTAVLTDSAGFFFFILSTLFLIREKYLHFSISTTIGVFAREAILFIIIAFILFIFGNFLNKNGKYNKYIFYILPPIFALIFVRLFFSFLPSFYWSISLDRLMNNLSRPISWATTIATILPFMVIIIWAWKIKKLDIAELNFIKQQNKILLIAIGLSCFLLFIYSLLSAFMSGRFLWPFYTVIIPISVIFGGKTIVFQKWINPLHQLLFL